LRSSKGSLKELISQQIQAVAKLVKGTWESHSSYPAWEYKEDSKIREIFKKYTRNSLEKN